MVARTSDIVQRDGVALVFGMEWFPLLGDHPQRQAHSLARRQRASHRVMAMGAAASVGLLRARAKAWSGQRLCSAAAVFASLHPVGTVAAILPLPGSGLWLVAVHEGAVMTRTDHLHEGPLSVQESLRLLHEAHPGLVVHDESRTAVGLLDSLFAAAQEQGELSRVRRWGLALSMAAILPALGLVLLSGRGLLQGDEPRVEADMVDPSSAWQDAMASVARRHTVHGVAGLQSVLDTLHGVPVYMAGWLLVQAECHPRLAEWHCRARYRRDEAGDNQSLIDAARPDWTLSFDPMEGALAVWASSMPVLALADVRLRGPRENEARLVSALQAMLPAFSEFRLNAPEPLPVPAPLDAQQRPIPRPPGVSGYQRRTIHLQAPLRSLSLLLPEASHMSWERIVLQVSVVDEPTLRASSLQASLSGVLYEIDMPNHAFASSVAGTLDGVRKHGG